MLSALAAAAVLTQSPTPDWLVDPGQYRARLEVAADGATATLTNGLVTRRIRLLPDAATVALDDVVRGASLLRAVEPEATVTLDGRSFAIGGLLAGIGAVITGLYNTSAHYQMGFQYGLYAFTAAVLGGIGNIPGAVLGGLVIGVVGELSKAYLGTEWSEAVVFTILIVILLFRPAGLLGARVREKV